MDAADLMLDVLATCVAKPKPAEPGAVAWATGGRDAIDRLVARSESSRQQHPPRTS